MRHFTFAALLIIMLTAFQSYAAQSTADVSISSNQKKAVLQEILGDKTELLQWEDEYIIGHGDILTVSIYEEGDMSVAAPLITPRTTLSTDTPRTASAGTPVMMDGRISLKDIGDVEVVGLTLTQLADYLKKLYSIIYDDPSVTTTLAQSNSLRYTVMGEVVSPGIFFLDYPMSLIQVVARAGGFSEWASKKITVVRQHVKPKNENIFKKNTLIFDYDDFIAGKSLDKNIFIQPNDIVIIN